MDGEYIHKMQNANAEHTCKIAMTAMAPLHWSQEEETEPALWEAVDLTCFVMLAIQRLCKAVRSQHWSFLVLRICCRHWHRFVCRVSSGRRLKAVQFSTLSGNVLPSCSRDCVCQAIPSSFCHFHQQLRDTVSQESGFRAYALWFRVA